MHVGEDLNTPTLMVDSIRLLMPTARVIQCTDLHTPKINGVSAVFRKAIDPERLMISRLKLFFQVGLNEPAIYLDTDMLLVSRFDPRQVLGNKRIAVCRRSFHRDTNFNTEMRGEEFAEYEGQPLGLVYPFLACSTITQNSGFWLDCLRELEKKPAKYARWYGDQEAIKLVIPCLDQSEVAYISEEIYGCLPEFAGRLRSRPILLHFKGASRKTAMIRYSTILHKKVNV